ncbi:MAG: tetraacyldisaccharide 4'-kinase, partial [Candidatus Delongbacteria bacterium]
MFYSKKPVISFIVSLLLMPVTLLYYIAVTVRHFLYDKKILHSYKPGIRTVSVGNITAGGTGKTPTVISLVNSLSAIGIRTAVVTRGYGRTSRSTIFVDENTPVSDSGDEPMVIYKKTKSTVVCEKDRYKAVKLLNNNYDMVVLDDAFQHRKIIKDIDIVLVDENRFLKNRLLLPLGNLSHTLIRIPRPP